MVEQETLGLWATKTVRFTPAELRAGLAICRTHFGGNWSAMDKAALALLAEKLEEPWPTDERKSA